MGVCEASVLYPADSKLFWMEAIELQALRWRSHSRFFCISFACFFKSFCRATAWIQQCRALRSELSRPLKSMGPSAQPLLRYSGIKKKKTRGHTAVIRTKLTLCPRRTRWQLMRQYGTAVPVERQHKTLWVATLSCDSPLKSDIAISQLTPRMSWNLWHEWWKK